jgi:hypothetical protein
MDDLAFLDRHDDGRIPNGAQGRKPCRRHQWMAVHSMIEGDRALWHVEQPGHEMFACRPDRVCTRCFKLQNAQLSRRGRANRERGNRAELDVARSIPGGVKMGPLGLPWDVEVGTYARLQVKKLADRPSFAEIVRQIERIPDTGDRLRGFVWIEAAGQGKRGRRMAYFRAPDFTAWHGYSVPTFANVPGLVALTLDEWVREYVG